MDLLVFTLSLYFPEMPLNSTSANGSQAAHLIPRSTLLENPIQAQE